ncbi:MAG TPA: ATP-dependent DNA ligase [Polyangiaceae bacterium]|nr:ATP-dependent DNA ligase [Polyangiaceae bacterium]
MLLETLVSASEAVEATPKRRQKVGRLAECLRSAGSDAAICVAFLCGDLRQGKLGIGYSTLQAARPERAAEHATLSLGEVDAEFEALVHTQGKGSKTERARRLHQLLARCTEREQRFLLKLITGELRQGALEAILVEAVAEATGVPAHALRRAVMFAGDLRQVATSVLDEGPGALSHFRLQLFQPVRPMLAQTASDLEEALGQLGEASAEYKLDGARVQIHKSDSDVRIYSRQLNDITSSMPEVVELARNVPARQLVLDGEVIALTPEGRPLPFQVTMRRVGRKLQVTEQRAELPLSVFLFDVLHRDGEDLVDTSYADRLPHLDGVTSPQSAAWRSVPRLLRPTEAELTEFAGRALEAGHEGVMVKALGAEYQAGRRGASWLKVKPVHTLDLVVLAAEWGSGRRKGWLSNLHLGARDAEQGGFVMLGKTFKGLTDALLTYQTAELLKREISRDAYTVYVKPELVVEIAFDGLQASPHYPGGLALRFARVRRYRSDKSADAADTIETVRKLYQPRLHQPGHSQSPSSDA